MSRSLTGPRLVIAAAFALVTYQAQAETTAQAEQIAIRVAPNGTSTAEFIPLRGCGTDADVAVRLGETTVMIPARALQRIQFSEGHQEREPIERLFPIDIGCQGRPIALKSLIVMDGSVVALMGKDAIDGAQLETRIPTDSNATVCSTPESGVKICTDPETEGRLITMADADAPMRMACTADISQKCRIGGETPRGFSYSVPTAGGPVPDVTAIAMMQSAQSLIRRLKTQP